MKMNKRMGITLLGVWLIVEGLTQTINLNFKVLDLLEGLLALVAGVLIVVDR